MKKLFGLLSLFVIFSQTTYGMFIQRALIAVKTMTRTASQKPSSHLNKGISLNEARNLLRERFNELAKLKYKQRSSGFNPDENFENDMNHITSDFNNILSHLGKQNNASEKN